MAGTIVADIIQSDQSYASSINIASPMVISNTLTMTNGTISGNVNFSSNTIFLDQTNNRTYFNVAPSQIGTLSAARVYANSEIRVCQPSNTISQLYVGTGPTYSYIGHSDTNKAFNIEVGGAARHIIDGSGRITTPYQPRFFAENNYSPPTVWSDGSRILSFNSTRYNVGSGYSTSTNRFTAPIAGYYFISQKFEYATYGASIVIRHPNLSFYVNGGASVSGAVGATSGSTLSGSAYQHFSKNMSTVIYLNANDYVECWFSYSADYGGNCYLYSTQYFWGQLIG